MGTCRVGTSSVEYEVSYSSEITIYITYLFIALSSESGSKTKLLVRETNHFN